MRVLYNLNKTADLCCFVLFCATMAFNRIALLFLVMTLCGFIATTYSQAPCAKWGNTFDVSLESSNIIRNCKLPDGRQICCAAVSNNTVTRGVGESYQPPSRPNFENAGKLRSTCTVKKVYFSSPQELRELAEADRIDSIPGDKSLYMIEARSHALLKYVTTDDYIRNSTIWLNRVKHHMSNPTTSQGNAADFGESRYGFEFSLLAISLSTVGF